MKSVRGDLASTVQVGLCVNFITLVLSLMTTANLCSFLSTPPHWLPQDAPVTGRQMWKVKRYWRARWLWPFLARPVPLHHYVCRRPMPKISLAMVKNHFEGCTSHVPEEYHEAFQLPVLDVSVRDATGGADLNGTSHNVRAHLTDTRVESIHPQDRC